MLKKKWIGYVGECWRGCITQLINEYITNPKDKLESSYVKYLYIYKNAWKDFVKSRTTPNFLAKSQKGKESRTRNIYPHRLSRGGYDKPEKIMIE